MIPAWIFSGVVVVMVVGITFFVQAERLWGAALRFVDTMIAGLITFNFYEPVADLFHGMTGVAFFDSIADMLVIVLVFGIAFTIVRLATDYLGSTMVKFPGIIDQIGGWVFGLLTAWYLVGMLLCICETAPVHKQFLGYRYEKVLLGVNRYWLGYVRSTTGQNFDWGSGKAFDEKADFIYRYHEHRPIGKPDPTFGDM